MQHKWKLMTSGLLRQLCDDSYCFRWPSARKLTVGHRSKGFSYFTVSVMKGGNADNQDAVTNFPAADYYVGTISAEQYRNIYTGCDENIRWWRFEAFWPTNSGSRFQKLNCGVDKRWLCVRYWLFVLLFSNCDVTSRLCCGSMGENFHYFGRFIETTRLLPITRLNFINALSKNRQMKHISFRPLWVMKAVLIWHLGKCYCQEKGRFERPGEFS